MKTRKTETKFKSAPGLVCYLFGRVLCLGAVILICSSASAQNLFVSDYVGGNIDELDPAGVRSIFASGVSGALAFDRAGNLFVASFDGQILKFTPDGARTTFASGLDFVGSLAFDSTGNLFVTTGDTEDDGFPING